MAKIVITIEDKDNGNVSIVSNPPFETMAKMDESGEGLTSAHGYALACINQCRKVSKSEGKNKILIPKVKY